MKRLSIAACLLLSSLAAANLLVSSDKPGDAPVYVGAPYSDKESAIAWGFGGGLVAWSTGSQVFAARLDDTNQVLDDVGVLLGAGERPAVAFDGTNYLVVFERTGSTTGRDILALRVSPAGAVLDSTPIVVSNAANKQTAPSVAYTGGVYLVVWEDARSGGSNIEFVMAARITPSGLNLDPNGLLLCQGPNSRSWPSVTAASGEFFAVWSDGRTSGAPAIYGTRVTPQGTVREPNGAVVVQGSSYSYVTQPAVAFDGTNFFVAYAISNGYSGVIRAVRVKTDLTVLDATPLPVSGNSSWDSVPNVSCGGGHCFVIWNHDDQYSDAVHLARVKSDGTVLTGFQPQYLGRAPSGVISGTLRRFGIAWNGSSFTATWHEQNRYQTSGGRSTDVYARRIALDGSLPDAAAVRVSSAANLQMRPSVSFNGTHYLAAWIDDRNDHQDIYAARFDESGALIDANGIAVSTAANDQTNPAVARIGSDWMVVWSDRRSGSGWDLYAARIAADGTLRDPNGIAVSTTSGDQTEPALACGADNCLAIWRDTRSSSSSDIYGSRIGADGSILDLGGLVVHDKFNSSYAPAVGFDGTQYMTAWVYAESGGRDTVMVRRLGANGAWLDALPTSVYGNDYAQELQLAAVQGNFVLAWLHASWANGGYSYAIRATQVPPPAGSTPATLAHFTNPLDGLHLASDGNAALAVWTSEPGNLPDDIWARHVGPTGAPLDGAAWKVLTMEESSSWSGAASIASRAPREWLLAYGKHHVGKPFGNTRIALRTLSPLPQGSACSADQQCGSGFCVDGVCCNSACGGGAASDCQACSAAKGAATNGTCAPIAQGTLCRASAGVCDAAEVCDGSNLLCPADAPAANGTSCDDGNACTQTDSCQAGACTGGNPVVCAAQSACHDAGVCNPSTGVCTNPVKPAGASCDDGNGCTRTDTCQSGVCTGTNPVTCAALDQCHVAGVCDPGTGLCSNPSKADGAACSDGDRCTRSDTCQAGVCTGSNPVTCAASDQCHDAGVCNPSTGVCSNPAKADGAACDDQNACTRADSCQAGACKGASPVVCTAKSQCHNAGVCNPATGVCSEPMKVNGTSCNDGDLCTRGDRCETGVCRGTDPVKCAPIDQCHAAGVCDPQSGRCSNPAKANGAACNDGNACTEDDACQAGICTGANPKSCTSANECEEAAACTDGACAFRPRADGTPCSGGTCNAGVCEAPPAPDAGTPPAGGGDGGAATGGQSGCGCGSAEGGTLLLAAPLIAALGARRRRR